MATGEATVEQVSTIHVVLFIMLTSGGCILNEVTDWWWERLAGAGLQFCPLLVLGDGKFDWLGRSTLAAVFHARYIV